MKRCLSEGAKTVFLSEQERAVFEVNDYPEAEEHIGYRLEVVASVDERARTMTVQSLKRLEYTPAMCAVPRKR